MNVTLQRNYEFFLADAADHGVDGDRVGDVTWAAVWWRPLALVTSVPCDAHVHELFGIVPGEAVADKDGGGGVNEVVEGVGWIVGGEGQKRSARVVVGQAEGLRTDPHIELGYLPGGRDFFDRLGELGQERPALGVDDWDGAGETEVELVAGDGGEIWGYIERRRWRCGRGDEDAAGKLAVHMRKLPVALSASGLWFRGAWGF